MSNQGVSGGGFFESYRQGLFKPLLLVDRPLSSLLAASYSFLGVPLCLKLLFL